MGRTRSFDTGEVLDKAVDVFWERGYDAVGMQEICRVTGLNSGSLYAAFGDKRGLFVQALQRYMGEVSQQAIERLNGNPSGLAGILDYFKSLVGAMVEGKRKWGCLVTNSVVEFAMADAEIAQAFRLHLARLEAAFAGAIERARRAGELPPGVPSQEAAAFLVCTVQGLNVLAKTQPGRKALETAVRVAIGALDSPNAAASEPPTVGRVARQARR